jgi:hypothetical protein
MRETTATVDIRAAAAVHIAGHPEVIMAAAVIAGVEAEGLVAVEAVDVEAEEEGNNG